MYHSRLLLINFFVALMIPGVGAGQDASVGTSADGSMRLAVSTVGDRAAPGLIQAGMWVAVRPDAKLNDGANELAAHTVPVIYHVHKVELSRPEPRYWLAGDVSGWANEADLLAPEDTLWAIAKLIRQCPSDPALYLARGLVETGIGRYLPAIADFDDVLRLDPHCATAYYNRGVANGELSQRERALGDLYEAIRLEPDNPAFYFARAVVAEGMKNRLRAIADYTTALRLDPGNAHAKAGLDRLSRQDRSVASPEDGYGTTGTAESGAVQADAASSGANKTSDSSAPPKTPLQVALEQAAIEEANARAAEARAKIEELRARIEEARARAERAMLDAERFRRQRTQSPTAESANPARGTQSKPVGNTAPATDPATGGDKNAPALAPKPGEPLEPNAPTPGKPEGKDGATPGEPKQPPPTKGAGETKKSP